MKHGKTITLFCAIISIASIASGAVFWDDFEAYSAGEIHGKGGWSGWDNTASAGSPVSAAQAYSGTKSIEIVPSADLTHTFDLTGGKWILTVMQYIPSGGTGNTYFILLNQYPDSKDWSIQTQYKLASGEIQTWTGVVTTPVVFDKWVQLKYVIDLGLNTVDEYYNGVLIDTRVWDDNDHVTLQAIDLYGNNASSVYYDDLKIEDFVTSLTAADNPSPAGAAVDVVREASLTWTPGYFAASHDVYLGTNYDDVANASRANPANVLASRSQTQSQFTPATLLDFGQTYYWRVDEVNAAPDNTIFPGEVWSFTAEPLAIPIEAITATASGANPDMDASKTIDGSGLNELDQHSTEPTAMWLAPTSGSWIQYEFDKAYKLHEMLVWNSNQVVEPFIGFGLKEVSIETSLDGEAWAPVQDVPSFAKGSAMEDYQANTAVDLSGIMAKYVKITVQSAHGFAGLSGLSEVRFLTIPTYARAVQPADQGISTGADVALTWRSGREATSHEVYLGAAADDLTLLGTVSENEIASGPLNYDQTYYWQVTEINEAATPSTYTGAVWSFTTPASGVVDDFESYSGEEGQEVFMAWFDGFGGDASLGGSTTGHIDGPFVETTRVYGGGQSAPIYYDNDGSFVNIDGNVSSPSFSEVIREFDSPQDWTASNVKSLSIMFSGSPDNTGQLYCKIGNTKLLYDGDAANLGLETWSAWVIDLSTVGGDLTRVRELTIGIEGGGSGVFYLDEIRLYP
jgi:hypothetical protein